MRQRVIRFFRHDSGQDLAEYCLLTALIALIALGILFRVSGGMQGLWGNANTALVQGNAATANPPAGSPSSGSRPTH